MNYDIIGDIHGHADELEILLQKLGYQLDNGIYKHQENRMVIFLGDFIDRGPKIREVLHIAKNMCDYGSAKAIMGNHEFNAICFHTLDTEKGGFFRKHDFKEIQQHYATLLQFQNFTNELMMFLDWFKTLPIYIEEKSFNVVHACWDNEHIDWLKNNIEHEGFPAEFLTMATSEKKKDEKAYVVIEELLKGKEFILPDGYSFLDKDGHKREECRVKWWEPTSKRLIHEDILLLCPKELQKQKLNDYPHYSYEGNKPIFFGHYWLKGTPELENEKAICLDYSVAKGGILVAYRSEYLEDENKEKGFVY